MEAHSTEVAVIEELPAAELYLLEDSQSATDPIAAGALQICRIQVSGTFFLYLPPDFRYVLSKTIKVLKGKDKRYILPTNQAGVLYGIVIRNPVKAKVALLDVVLEDQTEFIVHKHTFSDSVSSAVVTGGGWIAKGIKRGAVLAAVGFSKGKEKVNKMLDERRERKKAAARAQIEAKSSEASEQLPLSSVASMMAVNRAVASTDTSFAPPPPAQPLTHSVSAAKTSVTTAVTQTVAAASTSARVLADRVIQRELGLSGGTEDLMKGLRLLNAAAKYVDPAKVLQVAASAAQVAANAAQVLAPPRPQPS